MLDFFPHLEERVDKLGLQAANHITCQIISFRLSDSLLKLAIVTIEGTYFLVVLYWLHILGSEADGVNAKQIISCSVATDKVKLY